MAGMDVKRLLRRKGRTGVEVGKLLLTSLAYDIEQQKAGNPDPKELFKKNEFAIIEGKLEKDSDLVAYGVYSDIYRALVENYNYANSLTQQVDNGFFRMLYNFSELEKNEDAQEALSNTPLILTKKQYKEYKEKSILKVKAYKESFNSLLFTHLETYLEDISKAPKEIQAILKKLQSLKPSDPKIIKEINTLYNLGYFQLDSGERSDKMSKKEWNNLLEKKFLETHVLEIDGKIAGYEETYRDFKREAKFKAEELYYQGAEATKKYVKDKLGIELKYTDKEILDGLDTIIIGVGIKRSEPAQIILEALDLKDNTTFYIYDTLQDDTSELDILSIYADKAISAGTEREAIKELKKNYPDLFKALKEHLEETIPATKGLKANQYYKDLISRGELAELNILNYRDLISEDTDTMAEIIAEELKIEQSKIVKRVRFNGIAILQGEGYLSVDREGNYKQQSSPLYFFTSLEELAKDEYLQKDMADCRDILVKKGLANIYAYNEFIDILSTVYDLEDIIKIAKIDTRVIEHRIGAFNKKIYMFYHRLKDSEDKQKTLYQTFKPIDTSELKPTKEASVQVRDYITNLGLTRKARKEIQFFNKYLRILVDSTEGA